MSIHILCVVKIRKKIMYTLVQQVFHVYLNKFEMAISHLFLIIFCNN